MCSNGLAHDEAIIILSEALYKVYRVIKKYHEIYITI
jgi:hypothetical protein